MAKSLGTTGGVRWFRAWVMGCGRCVDEKACRLKASCHIRKGVRDCLLITQGTTKDLPLAGIGDGGIQGRLAHTYSESADARPEEVKCAHCHPESIVYFPEHIVAPDAHAVEEQATDRVWRE